MFKQFKAPKTILTPRLLILYNQSKAGCIASARVSNDILHEVISASTKVAGNSKGHFAHFKGYYRTEIIKLLGESCKW